MIQAFPAKPEDAFELQLRDEDAREVSPGWREGLVCSIERDLVIAYRDSGGRLLGLFGVSSFDNEVSPWLLCSPLVEHHKRFLWRKAKRMVDAIRRGAQGRLIYNYIPKDSHANRRFVEALGFRILPSPRDGFDFFYLPHV